jgi:hypothetical protein
MSATDDIPSLTLRVLQSIQTELVGLRSDVRQLDSRMGSVEAELKTLNGRFDQFLLFSGKDVSDLKERVSRLEARAHLAE